MELYSLAYSAFAAIGQMAPISDRGGSGVIEWIESHEKTVDLLKWVAAGLLAWSLGVVRYIRMKLKRPTIEIELFTSRCACDDLGEIDGSARNIRAIYVLQIGVNNPTTDPIVIRDFTIATKAMRRWPIWQEELYPTTLPTRPQHSVGTITKILKCWFSNFHDDLNHLSLMGKIEPREFQSGYLLFTSVTWGDLEPRIINGKTPVRATARLTTGETLRTKALIRVVDDPSIVEGIVPGILDHTKNSSTWNIIRTRY
ncbi:TPA: hypothetical protein ACOEQZ_001128 [Stenotrophomonas maltophilia]